MHPPIILFDFDGVIITQKALEYTALKLKKNSWYNWKNIDKLRLIDFARLFEESDNTGWWSSLKSLNSAYKPYIPNKLKRWIYFSQFNKLYQKFEKLYDAAKPNLKEILIKLSNNQFPMAIVSNTERSRLNFFIHKFKLDKHISVFITRGDSKQYKKPHPYPILLALSKIKKKFKLSKVFKENVYFIGDLPSDILSAKAAKINSIAVLSGHGRREDLMRLSPTYLIQNIIELLEVEPLKKFLMN
ncbi:MAG: HAD family hydrolase [Promethearchaeota archaeon]